MAVIDQTKTRNQLLRLFPADAFASLAPHLAPVNLPKGTILSNPEEPFARAIFIDHGIGSIVSITPELQEAESGLFGRDGVTPTGLVLGADRAPYRVLMQVGGAGLQLPAEILRRAAEDDSRVRRILLRYAQVLSVQSSFTALSNAVHPVDERLARWLLMCHDRVDGDELPLTHESLSIMLAVRRPSVTTALHVLEGNRFITAERGNIIIRNRQLLEEYAADAYGRPELEYTRLLGPTANLT